MMVAGLRRAASTSRRRNCGTLERLPAPARFGARSPWNRTSGSGAEWQRTQVELRSATSARPRAGSPGAPVSESAMPSPEIVYDRSDCACAPTDEARVPAAIMAASILAKSVHRDGLVPVGRRLRLLGADVQRRIDRAGAATFDLGEDVALGLIDAREREGITGRDGV